MLAAIEMSKTPLMAHHEGTDRAIEPKSFSAQLDQVDYYPVKFEADRLAQNRRCARHKLNLRNFDEIFEHVFGPVLQPV